MTSNDRPACFVATIDLALAEKLQEDLSAQGFEMAKPPHTFFSAKKQGLSCTLYLSGKLTVQGKGKDEFISFYLEPEILKNFSYSYPAATEIDPTPRIGEDEAGKGDFFGPLCMAGLYAGEDKVKELLAMGVRDSKKMNDKSVIEMSKKLKKSFPHKVLRIFPEKYNELYAKFHNLNRMLSWGHSTVIEELIQTTQCKRVILDQFAPADLMLQAMQRKNVTLELIQRFRAEEDPVVAAASILARAGFLEGLEELGQKFKITLLKGASDKVIEQGKKLVDRFGEDILRSVGKLHFKTRDAILNDRAPSD